MENTEILLIGGGLIAGYFILDKSGIFKAANSTSDLVATWADLLNPSKWGYPTIPTAPPTYDTPITYIDRTGNANSIIAGNLPSVQTQTNNSITSAVNNGDGTVTLFGSLFNGGSAVGYYS